MHTAYFGNIEWYRKLFTSIQESKDTDDLRDIIDFREHWQKQTERNRCIIATANGTQMLTIPISIPSTESQDKKKICTGDILISDHGNWRHLHWNALTSAYGMSPFFDYYADEIKPFFSEKWEKLYDFNLDITKKIIDLIGGRDIIIQRTYDNMNREKPSDAEIPQYYQTFQKRHGFIPNLSILDLIFNEGPSSILYI